MDISVIENFTSEDAFQTYKDAWDNSERLLAKARPIVAESLKGSALDPKQICISVVGSTARREAMKASDIDLLPIWCGDGAEFPHFEDLTGKVREDLRRKTGLDVSTSRNLMRSTQLTTLCKADGIGGDDDYRRSLTQRMLVLTESEQLGGEYPIKNIRESILEAYVGERDIERTVSKHPMVVCNDIARYYRTLCVDYKSRTESKPESWAERHAKLRNARKLWYFSTVMAIAHAVSSENNGAQDELFKKLEEIFSWPPIIRLFSSITDENSSHAKEILNLFSLYLKNMSDTDFRQKMSTVDFNFRNNKTLPNGEENTYFEMHSRSREFSEHMINMMLATSENAKLTIYKWFFL